MIWMKPDCTNVGIWEFGTIAFNSAERGDFSSFHLGSEVIMLNISYNLSFFGIEAMIFSAQNISIRPLRSFVSWFGILLYTKDVLDYINSYDEERWRLI